MKTMLTVLCVFTLNSCVSAYEDDTSIQLVPLHLDKSESIKERVELIEDSVADIMEIIDCLNEDGFLDEYEYQMAKMSYFRFLYNIGHESAIK